MVRIVCRRLLVCFALAIAFLGVTAARASAGECDLYTTSSTCLAGTVLSPITGNFLVTGPQPTGTGVIDSFLRVQQKGFEQGFNTNERQSVSNPAGMSAGYC